MTKLNQIVAVLQGVKAQAHRNETGAYQRLSKLPLWTGRIRTYQPKDEDGDQLPPESQLVQLSAKSVVESILVDLTRLFDVVFTHETGNTAAFADVVVDGETLLANAPVTYLLFLQKELEKLANFAGKIPVLDPEQTWTYSPEKGAFQSAPVKTVRNRKVNVPMIYVQATKEHPAQAAIVTEDVMAGTWTQVNLSGGLPADTVDAIQRRIVKVREAVRFAKEEANSREIADLRVGDALLKYVFQPVLTIGSVK